MGCCVSDHAAPDNDGMSQLLLNATQAQSTQTQTQQRLQHVQSEHVVGDEETKENEDEKEEDEADTLMEEIMNDSMTLLTTRQFEQLKQDGYCVVDDPMRQKEIAFAVSGYVRQYYDGHNMEKYLLREIVYFYGSRFNTNLLVELVLNNTADNDPLYFLVPRRNLKLSEKLHAKLEECSDSNKIELEHEKLNVETMQHVLRYLGRHKGRTPAPLPCPVRSIHMTEIVTDPWDAHFIDVFQKKQVFEIILVAHHFAIAPLTHLACAKIATLIKQLDQTEINRIIEEEERYRREQAQNNNNDQDDDDNKDDHKDQEDDRDDDDDDAQNAGGSGAGAGAEQERDERSQSHADDVDIDHDVNGVQRNAEQDVK